MTSTYELAKQYYPRLWSKDRLKALLSAGKLTEMEYYELVNKPSSDLKDTTK